MAKKRKASMPMLYCIGMLVTAIGYILPIFRKTIDAFGKTAVLFSINGFDLVGDGDSTMKIMALLIFIGAVLGVILALLPKVPQAKIIQLIAIVISVVGFSNTAFRCPPEARYLLAQTLGFAHNSMPCANIDTKQQFLLS